MHGNAPVKPSLDDRIRRRMGILLRQMYDDQLHAELPPKLAAMADRLIPTSESPAFHSRWSDLYAASDPAVVSTGSRPTGKSERFWNGVVFWPSRVSFWGGAPPRRRSASILNSNSANAGSPKTAGTRERYSLRSRRRG